MNLAKVAVRLVGALLLGGAGCSSAIAAPVVYDFDTFDDFTPLTTQYAGLTFSHATVLKAGLGLNDSAVPPHSGDGVVFDDAGAIGIVFSAPVFSAGGFFTYSHGLTLSAYDINDVLLDSSVALFTINYIDGSGEPGSSANEFLQVTSSAGLIARIAIASDPFGDSFALDDLTVDNGERIPEPSTIALMAAALGAGLRRRGRPRL